jgi:hypothetical protein
VKYSETLLEGYQMSQQDLVILLISTGLSIPVGIITALVAPRVQDWLNQRPRVSVIKRKQALESEYNIINQLFQDRSLLSLRTTNAIILILLFQGAGNLSWIISSATYPLYDLYPFESLLGVIQSDTFIVTTSMIEVILIAVGFIMFLAALVISINHIRLVRKVMNCPEYLEELRTRIESLD